MQKLSFKYMCGVWGHQRLWAGWKILRVKESRFHLWLQLTVQMDVEHLTLSQALFEFIAHIKFDWSCRALKEHGKEP